MAPGARASGPEDLIEIINQALDEVEDLRAAIEYDEEYLGESSIVVEPVSQGLSRLLSAVHDEIYNPGEGDWLQFLEGIRGGDHRAMPFWPVLKLIIDTHEQGYQSSPDGS